MRFGGTISSPSRHCWSREDFTFGPVYSDVDCFPRFSLFSKSNRPVWCTSSCSTLLCDTPDHRSPQLSVHRDDWSKEGFPHVLPRQILSQYTKSRGMVAGVKSSHPPAIANLSANGVQLDPRCHREKHTIRVTDQTMLQYLVC